MTDFHEPHEPPAAHERRGFDRLTPLSQAFAALAAYCKEIAPTPTPIDLAADRIAAAPIRASRAVPARPVALREGWAVAAQDTLGASSYAPGIASAAPLQVRFGDALPDFADAVLPLSGVASGSPFLEILGPAAPGEGARARGGDFTEGEIIVGAGERLRPVHVALGRLAGIEQASLRVPRVRILSHGGAGDWLAAMAAREGAQPHLESMEQDDLERGLARPDADLVVAICPAAGDSPGQILARAGKLLAHGLAIRPGEAMGCGILRDGSDETAVPVVFAPERIECQLAAWLLLVRPCLRRLAGALTSAHSEDLGEDLVLTRKITSNPGIADLVLVRRVIGAGGAAMWEPLATGDIPWAAMARADAWLLVEPECEGYAAGRNVFAQFL